MALVNHSKREINAKIVFVGPGFSGKSTMLQFVYRKLKPELRGKLKSMNLQNDKMMFFDFQPNQQQPMNGYSTRFHIYTLTGDVSQQNSWKMVMKGADGVIFVADSSPERVTANLEAMQTLSACLNAYDIGHIPRILLCNKRDLPDTLSIDDLRITLDADEMPAFPTIVNSGEGVLEGVSSLIKAIMKRLSEDIPEAGDDIRNVQSAAIVQEAFLPQKEKVTLSQQDDQASKGIADTLPEADQLMPADAIPQPELAVSGNPELLADGKTACISMLVKYAGGVQRIDLKINVSLPEDTDTQ